MEITDFKEMGFVSPLKADPVPNSLTEMMAVGNWTLHPDAEKGELTKERVQRAAHPQNVFIMQA